MGLFLAYVDVWNTKKPGNRKRLALYDLFLLNTNRLSDIHKMDEANFVDFLYSDDPDDARDSPGYIEAYLATAMGEDQIVELQEYHDIVFASKFATLPIFPNMDIIQTPVDTLVEWDDIAYVYATYQDWERDTCHVVYYENAWKRIECIVDTDIVTLWGDQTAPLPLP